MKHNNFERRSWHFIKLTTRKGRVGFLSWKWAFSEWTGWVWKVQSWKCLNSNCSNPILIQQCYFQLFCSWCSWTKLVSSTSFFSFIHFQIPTCRVYACFLAALRFPLACLYARRRDWVGQVTRVSDLPNHDPARCSHLAKIQIQMSPGKLIPALHTE